MKNDFQTGSARTMSEQLLKGYLTKDGRLTEGGRKFEQTLAEAQIRSRALKALSGKTPTGI